MLTRSSPKTGFNSPRLEMLNKVLSQDRVQQPSSRDAEQGFLPGTRFQQLRLEMLSKVQQPRLEMLNKVLSQDTVQQPRHETARFSPRTGINSPVSRC